MGQAYCQVQSGSSEVDAEGKLTPRSYEDKEGNTPWVSEIIVNYFRLISARGSTEEEQPDPEAETIVEND